MEKTARPQRRTSRRKSPDPSVIRIELKDGMGHPRWITADLVDFLETGFGVALLTPLQTGSTVLVVGKMGDSPSAQQRKAGVRWCIEKSDGTYRAGLEFLDSGASSAKNEQPPPRNHRPPPTAIPADTLDC